MTRIGFVGVGAISGIYLENITNRFKDIEIIGVCDLIRERAENAVKKYNIPKLYNDMYELFADPEVDIVLNITRPYEHYEVSKAALLAGKDSRSQAESARQQCLTATALVHLEAALGGKTTDYPRTGIAAEPNAQLLKLSALLEKWENE